MNSYETPRKKPEIPQKKYSISQILKTTYKHAHEATSKDERIVFLIWPARSPLQPSNLLPCGLQC